MKSKLEFKAEDFLKEFRLQGMIHDRADFGFFPFDAVAQYVAIEANRRLEEMFKELEGEGQND